MKPGKKPSPTHKKALLGTARATREKKRVNEPEAYGLPFKPAEISEAASAIWDTYATWLPWLRAADSDTFMAWCTLTAQFRKRQDDMGTTRLAQWRAFGELLGVSPSARARLGEGTVRSTQRMDGSLVGGNKEWADKYFNE